MTITTLEPRIAARLCRLAAAELAGEALAAATLRRILVEEYGIPREQVAAMVKRLIAAVYTSDVT